MDGEKLVGFGDDYNIACQRRHLCVYEMSRNVESLMCFQIEHHMLFNLLQEEEQLRAMRRLVEEGADIHYQLEYGSRNALMLSICKDSEHLVQSLLVSGSDLERGDTDGRTALHIAVIEGNAALARALLDAGANLEARTKAGNTPLMLACHRRSSSPEVLDLLVQRGARMDVTNQDGNNALAIAKRYASSHLLARLLVHLDAQDMLSKEDTALLGQLRFSTTKQFTLEKLESLNMHNEDSKGV